MKGRDEGPQVRRTSFERDERCENEAGNDEEDDECGDRVFEFLLFVQHGLVSSEVMVDQGRGAQREECES